ncbi:LOW QUALITY PROTEIN: neurotrophin 1 [Procambarus clarkii]|uniref:LOW QUALITY PROTEIN: neurotrophin 1 n=1 Tax=Procambarus clarkii TaxID=6728 RepID=UPI001E67683A|nr:neurotrophin 1-like [Procambarus clarkii]
MVMSLVLQVAAVLVGLVAGDADPDAAIISHRGSFFHPTAAPHHAFGPTPAYGSVIPSYHAVASTYHAYPPYHQPYKCRSYNKIPACSYNTTKSWCLYDHEYPEYEIKDALQYHKASVLPLYADVADLDTSSSVYRPRYLLEETYLCPSETSYVRPLRAVNTDGHWRIIVNNVNVDYEFFTQTTRLEECLGYSSCPLVPHCYESKCLQKSTFHRFLVFDPCDQYFPFSVETFKLPASCSCQLGAYYIDH